MIKNGFQMSKLRNFLSRSEGYRMTYIRSPKIILLFCFLRVNTSYISCKVIHMSSKRQLSSVCAFVFLRLFHYITCVGFSIIFDIPITQKTICQFLRSIYTLLLLYQNEKEYNVQISVNDIEHLFNLSNSCAFTSLN